MQDLIRKLLAELGEDPGREGLLNTPKRVERALRFLTGGYAMDVDAAWVKRTDGPSDLFKLWYYGHNVSFAMGGAMMAGDAPAALKIGNVFRAYQPEKGNAWAQYSAGRGWGGRGPGSFQWWRSHRRRGWWL